MSIETEEEINFKIKNLTYFYDATAVSVIDGDTYDFDVDCGFHIKNRIRVRLFDINCPEMRGDERPYGMLCADRVHDFFDESPRVRIFTRKSDSFGRWLAEVWAGKGWTPDSKSLGTILIEEGWGTRWRLPAGESRTPWMTSECYPMVVEP